MKQPGFVLGIALLTTAASPFAFAQDDDYADDGYFDYANVIHTEPVYTTERVNSPRHECWDEQVTEYRDGNRSYTGPIVGGIVGGAIGNRFGHGSGRSIATIAGLALGASIGNDVSRHDDYAYNTTRERCREVDNYYEQRHSAGYDVTYRYRGHNYVTHTDADPGNTLRVKVSVSPADGASSANYDARRF